MVARLKANCASLSEEQLAKLGVVLFNCQAEIEGRRTYSCTDEMVDRKRNIKLRKCFTYVVFYVNYVVRLVISMFQTIKECTADMDSDTWNAYHIVSNRARSVCYATRQQLFRRRAEHTVNALISTATSQLDAMKDLKVDFCCLLPFQLHVSSLMLDQGQTLCGFICFKTGGPAGVEGANCSLLGQAAAGPQRSAGPTRAVV